MKAVSLSAVIGLTVVFLCLTVDAFSAGQISVSAVVSRGSIPFEGIDTLTVSLNWVGEPFQYVIDSFPMPAMEKFKILGSSSATSTVPTAGGEETHRTFIYVLSPVDYGTGVIAPLNLTAKNRTTGEMTELNTGRITIEIAKPLPVSKNKIPSFVIILGAISAVIIMAAIAGFLVLRSKKRPAEVAAPQLRYIDALDAIKKETISDRKLFYSRLYRLLLQFIEKERGLAVSGKTGEEVIGIVASLSSENERSSFTAWLQKALEEKYLPDMPSSGEVENSYNAVRKFFESMSR
jgi:hypothetical protein